MRAMGSDVTEELTADVLFANVPAGSVGEANDHWGMEHATAFEKVMHPSAAEEGGHDGASLRNAIGVS